MGVYNTVYSSEVQFIPANGTEKKKKYFLFGVFFDGTGNDMTNNHYQTVDVKNTDKKSKKENNKKTLSTQVNNRNKFVALRENNYNLDEYYNNKDNDDPNDYSNIALLHHCFQGMNDVEIAKKINEQYDVHIYNIYVEGPGTTGGIDNVVGAGFGRGSGGVLALLSQAAKFIRNILAGFGDITNAEFHFDVFGFSRGATLARMFSTTILDKDCPDILLNNETKDLRELINKSSASVDFLGLFDTVSSIGTGTNDVHKYGLYLHKNVKGAMQLCASDEFRKHFALTDLGDSVNTENISEFFIPGCHTDVGGTYKTKTRTLNIEHETLLPRIDLGSLKVSREPLWMFVDEPNKRGGKSEINVETLEKLGWYSKEKDNISKEHNNFKISRLVLQGYNLVPLKILRDRANVIAGNEVFRTFPSGYSRFDIDKNLEALTNDMINNIGNHFKGRHFIYPQGAYNSNNYRKLRNFYINYSADVLNPVNAPSFTTDKTMCRMIVNVDDNSVGYSFMCDYNLNELNNYL